MKVQSIHKRVVALSPKAKELFIAKVKATLAASHSGFNASNRKRIVAYIKQDEELSLEQLKADLKKKLPDYMIPSQFITVKEIPLLPNGKLDRKQLPKIAASTPVRTSKTTHTTTNDLEAQLIHIWQETLGIQPIHPDDNFFELGGDSILSIQIIAKARKQGIILKPNDLFEYQTVSELASTTAIETKTGTSSIEDRLVHIWEETLGFSPIHSTDNFFEIGGDSILSIQIIAKARAAGIILKPNDLFEYQTIAELAVIAQIDKEDNLLIEESLVKIWEKTLGFSPIHKDDNFFEIGGDSILSIQIIALAQKEGILLRANDLFEHQTISKLSRFAKTITQQASVQLVKGEVLLTPIDYWFFEQHKNAPQFWNQAIRLDSVPKCSKENLKNICDFIVGQHDALRLRFRYDTSGWVKDVVAPKAMSALEFIDIREQQPSNYEPFVQQQIQRVQENFKLEEGNLFKCIYFLTESEDRDFCVLLAHHLLVDAISWQIITDDFKDAIRQVTAGKPIAQQPKTSSIQEWTEHLRAYAKNMSNDEHTFWNAQITPTPRLPFDHQDVQVIEEKDISSLPFKIDVAATDALQQSNKAYRTKTEELLITAFVNTIRNWTQASEVAIGFERHGRETLKTQLDVSRTVGWFTSYFPVKFKGSLKEEIGEKLVSVKEKWRSVPNGGIGYGVLRYLTETLKGVKHPEIVFNFLGVQTTNAASTDFKETFLTDNLRDPRSERSYKLEVNIRIIDGVLQGAFSYSNTVYKEQTIEDLVRDFKNQIHEMSDHCTKVDQGGYSPSDFKNADISQGDLDNLMDLLS